MSETLADLAKRLASLAKQTRELAAQHPDWIAEQNHLRNYRFEDGKGNYTGYVDMNDDEVHLND